MTARDAAAPRVRLRAILVLGLLLGLLPRMAAAHDPHLVDPAHPMSFEAPYPVGDPEHSQAFFAELTGTPHVYAITWDRPFRFYAGLTLPRIEGCPRRHDVSLDVIGAEGGVIERLDGTTFDWWPWYEHYGDQWYWVGPELGAAFRSTRTFPAGTYLLRVYNGENSGKYVLATGDDERFGFWDILRLWPVMRRLNREFWDAADCAAPG